MNNDADMELQAISWLCTAVMCDQRAYRMTLDTSWEHMYNRQGSCPPATDTQYTFCIDL